jgi:pimeloyl-ACP methyl ester carboxylesterase
VPTLLLSGGESPAALRKAAEAVKETLSDSRIVVMAGQGHAAMDTRTDLFTTEVLRFVEGVFYEVRKKSSYPQQSSSLGVGA